MSCNVLNVYPNDEVVSTKLCEFIVDRAQDAIKSTGSFLLGVSGGSLMKAFCKGLSGRKDVDFTQWSLFLCDERHVLHTDDESTYGYYEANFVKTTAGMKAEQFYPTDVSIEVSKAADLYQEKLLNVSKGLNKFSLGHAHFDLMLLGMGPDGHTCSLFPGHALFTEKTHRSILSISDSPKPPSQRVTFTLPLVNNCNSAAFMCCGQGKAVMIKRITEEKDQTLPCAQVKPKGHGEVKGQIFWFIDEPAASKLTPSS